jgi:hypothetical protein
MPSNDPRPRRVDRRHAISRRPQPSVSRRSPIQGRYAPPSADRLMRIKDAGRAPGVSSAVARGVILVAVIALVGAIALAITGGLGGAIGDLGHSLGGLIGGIGGPSPTPANSDLAGPEGAPRLEVPVNPWTNVALWDVSGVLPSGAAGSTTLRLRVYVGEVQVTQIPVPATADFMVKGVPLQPGWNEISAAIVEPSGEGPRSAAIKVNFDDVPPGLKISSPKNGAKVTATSVTVTGTTQAGSSISVHNDLTGGSANTSAATSGSFKMSIDIGTGVNPLTITATDPAGNETSDTVSVSHGSGALTAKLSLSDVRIAQSTLPETIVITLKVTDVGGGGVDGAKVTFSLLPPGQPPTTFSAVTNNGVAKWTTTIPKSGTTVGSGFVTARAVLPDGRVVTASAGFAVT